MRPAALLLLLLLAGAHVRSLAQEAPSVTAGDRLLFKARHFGVKDGLPHRSITSITQDQRGFIWAATPQGLARFDGYGFRNYTKAEGLSSDAVRKVACDGNGELWVLHINGLLDIMDPLTGAVKNLQERFAEHLPATVRGPITDLMSGADGTIVFAQNANLVRYRDVESGFQVVPFECAGKVLLSHLTQNGDAWCACRLIHDGEWPVDLVQQRFIAPDGSSSPKEVLRIKSVRAELASLGRDLTGWGSASELGTYVMHLGYIRPGGDAIEPMISNSGDRGNAESHGLVRMPLAEGVWLVNTKVRRMQDGDDPFKAPVLFDLVSVFPEAQFYEKDVLRDRSGTIWIAGEFGLFQLVMRADHFQRFMQHPSGSVKNGYRIRGMVETHGRLHVNTEVQGYWVLDATSGEVLRSDTSYLSRQAMIPDGAGGLWRGVRSSLLHEDADGALDRVVSAMADAYNAWSILLQANGSLLIGSERGLRIADAGSDRSRAITTGSNALDDAWVWYLAQDPRGGVFACTNAGLFRLDTNGIMMERCWPGASRDTDPAHHLPTDDIRYVHVDSAGVCWLATATKGLLRWDRNNAQVRIIGSNEGLSVASIHAIYPDDAGQFWMPTDNGLVRYDPRTGQVKVFTTADGITSNEFNRLAHARGADGRFYFGGIEGITVVDPAVLRTVPAVPVAPLVIKKVLVQRDGTHGPEDRTTLVLEGAPINMRPGDRFFTVEFALLSFQDPALIRYAWRVDGIDAEWNTQGEPYVRFTTLPYGDHVLRIKAQDAEGRWSEEIGIPIIMIKPAHLRWWFIALCVLVIGAGTYAFVRYREQQLRRMIRMRDRIATDLHDEVGSNLSSIVLFSTAVSKHSDTLPEYASDMLQRMKDNSKRAMESMNDIVWSVNSGHDSMEDLLDRMRAYAEPLCEAAGIHLEFDVEAAPLTRKLVMEERKNLYLVFKEALSNAVRHARCERIQVTLRAMNGSLELVVDDDGIGLPEEAASNASLGGNGLGNMMRRAGDIHGTLQVLAGATQGTRVILRFVTTKD